MPISFWLVALVPCVLHCPMISRGRKRKHPTENPSEFAPRNTSIPIASLADYANTSGETWLLASSGMAPRKGVSPRRGDLTNPPALGRQPLTGQGLFFQMPPGMSRGNMGRGASFNVSGWRPDSPTPTRPDLLGSRPDPIPTEPQNLVPKFVNPRPRPHAPNYGLHPGSRTPNPQTVGR